MPSNFNLAKSANFGNLLAAWSMLETDGGPGAGEDGLTFRDFGKQMRNNALREVSRSIVAKTYRPYPVRTASIPKGDGRFRELKLQTIMDRVAAKAMLNALNPWIRGTFPNYGRDVWRTYAGIANRVRRDRTYWLAIDDIRNCFPTVPTAPALEAFCRDFDRADDLVWIVNQIIRGHDGCDKLVGVEQGSPLAPPVVEAFLYRCLDTVLGAQYPGNPLRFRYYDNLPILANNESEGLRLLQATGEILEPYEMSLKAEDVSGDMRDPEYSGVLLGFVPHWENGQLTFTIPESSFADLATGLNNANRTSRPSLTAEYVAHGWLQAHGPALTNTVLPMIIDRVIQSARQTGFRILFRQNLLETGRIARKRWLRLLDEESRHD